MINPPLSIPGSRISGSLALPCVRDDAWPSGWAWHEGAPSSNDYYMIIVGVYAVLGVFLILAARDPLGNRSLIWFTVTSSLVHGAIMGLQSFGMSDGMSHMGHLMGDVPALIAIAAILGGLLWSADRSVKAPLAA
jgi:asparagine N-glycosylation enzyme membrane subunit Stt3